MSASLLSSEAANPQLRVVPPTAEARCSAVLARQFSLWPFGTRTLRLSLLLDPSRIEPLVQRGVLRAMQEAYTRAETGSQTNAVKAAALAAHYVLRHHNHDVLGHDRITASVAVAATRGRTAYVCLIGEAAAFALRQGVLTGQRTGTRVMRPVGREQDPRVTLWSTPLEPGDRLILLCGAPSRRDVLEVVAEAGSDGPTSGAEDRLSMALSAPGHPVRVLVDEAGQAVPSERRLTLVPPRPEPPARWGRLLRHWLAALIPLALLCAALLAVLAPVAEAPSIAAGQRAQDLLAQVDTAPDANTAHGLAATALVEASRAAMSAPYNYGPLVDQITRRLDEIDRAAPVTPAVAVHLGPGGSNVVDLAAGDTAVYTLDPVEGTIRAFASDALEQSPTPQTVLMRKGSAVGARRLATPIAMQYVPSGESPGELVVLDEARTLVQQAPDGSISTQPLPSSSTWQQLGALGTGPNGGLFVLDSGARRLFAYGASGQRLADPPRLLLDPTSGLEDTAWQHVAELVSVGDLYLRMDDGKIRRYAANGRALSFDVQPPDGPVGRVAAIAADRSGGLYLADPAHARVVQTTAEGAFVRQLRSPALSTVRELQSSPDGRRLYGLIPAGVLALDVPSE